MKLTIKTIKPRNPHALAAKQRNAGAHGEHQKERRQRRSERQSLRLLVAGQRRGGDNDG
jgi:hypothetical protein